MVVSRELTQYMGERTSHDENDLYKESKAFGEDQLVEQP